MPYPTSCDLVIQEGESCNTGYDIKEISDSPQATYRCWLLTQPWLLLGWSSALWPWQDAVPPHTQHVWVLGPTQTRKTASAAAQPAHTVPGDPLHIPVSILSVFRNVAGRGFETAWPPLISFGQCCQHVLLSRKNILSSLSLLSTHVVPLILKVHSRVFVVQSWLHIWENSSSSILVYIFISEILFLQYYSKWRINHSGAFAVALCHVSLWKSHRVAENDLPVLGRHSSCHDRFY